tara:strand:+ start:28 stop:231 length:204 start_codon:yes stop_codon:yes gene_type:complete
MAKARRPYSHDFPSTSGKAYTLTGIPPSILIKARARGKREGRSLRHVLLSALTRYAKPSGHIRGLDS